MIRWPGFILLWLLCALAVADEPLHPLQAFRPEARALDGQTIEVRFEIASGHYLYRDKFRFSAEPASVQLGHAVLPKGTEKMDETFGKVEVYFREVSIRLPVSRTRPGPLPLILNITSQGCADAGICYPPQNHSLRIELPGAPPAALRSDQSHDESGRIAGALQNASFWWAAASFFGFGLLLSLTPCVFPMVPILSGIIVGSGRNGRGVSHGRGFALSLAYVLGMAVAYAAAGVAAGFSGTLLASALQNAWVLGGFALVFVALALSMFGLYELQLPSFLQSKASEEAAHIKGGSLPGVALMGALSAVVVGPCVAPPLAGALLYIGRSGDALLGGAALFCLALGMGAPLLAVGLSAGTLLPKSGAWMEAVNKVFGIVLLAIAVWIVSPLISVAVQMAAWALLLIVPAIFLRAIDPLPPQARNWQRFGKAVGVVMLLAGAAMLAGALSGARDPLRPLAEMSGAYGGEAPQALPFERIRSVAELDERLESPGVPVMLDFYADWCAACKEMERLTFSDPRVRESLAGWRLLKVDVTANSEEDKALLARFRLYGPPGIVFFDRSGAENGNVRVVGFQNADGFLRTLASLRR